MSEIAFVEESHIFGGSIARNDFPDHASEILAALEGLEIPFGPSDPFTTTGRPKTPKRQKVKIGGVEKPAIFPVTQRGLNQQLKSAFRDRGWAGEPIAVGKTGGFSEKLGLKGDFVKTGVFVEVEFGNVASLSRDLLKFQIANRAEQGEVGVLITATRHLAKFMDQGVATFEAAASLLPAMRLGIQMPIWILGVEPTDWASIGARYEEMYKVCAENGVDCHTYETVNDGARDPEVGQPEEPPAEEQEG